MGGINETVADQKKVTEGRTEVIGKIRYHEKTEEGEIHFHDDQNNLKVAVPVATWFEAWQRLEAGQIDRWIYPDLQRKTVLEVRIVLTSPSTGPATLDVAMSVRKVELSSDFTKLQTFSTK